MTSDFMFKAKFKIIIWIMIGLGMFLLYKFINKDSLMGVINQSLPPKEARLLGGMIIGDTSGFDKDFLNQLKRSGIIHLVVVSGTNVILLAQVVIENLASWIGRRKAIILGSGMIWSYALLVGLEPPVVRASLLISIFYWAQILGRKYSLSRSLVLTVLIMVVADYQMLLGVSFWLSFGAFLGVVWAPKLKLNWFLRDIFITLWVSLWVTPILALNFSQISLVSFLTNALVLGLVEIISLIGGLGAVVGVFSLILGKIILILIYPLLKYLVVIVESLGNLGWASINFKFNWWLVAGWYVIFGAYLWRKNHEN